MNLATILNRLQSIRLPLAYLQFKATAKKPAPAPPFVVWYKKEHARGADDHNNIRETEMWIEVYTDTDAESGKDAEIIRMLETVVLPDVEYSKNQAYIESEAMNQTAYDFTIIEKRSALHGKK